jgi:O-antigen/teichoic acid export membrane protein
LPDGRALGGREGLGVRRNVLSGPATRIVVVAVVLVSYPVYLRALGFERYGLWLVLSTVLMLSQLGNLGIAQALAKVVAEAHAAGDTLAVRQYSTLAAAALAGSGVAATAVLSALRGPIVRALGLAGPNAALAFDLLPYCGLLAILVFLSDAQGSVLAGLGRQDLANVLDALTQAVAAALGILLVRSGHGVEGLLAAALAARLLEEGVALALTVRMLQAPPYSLVRVPGARVRHLASLSAGLFGGTAVSLLLNPLNRVVLARFAGLGAVPVYEIAYNGALQLRSLLAAASAALTPEVSRLRAAGAQLAVCRLTRRVLLFLVACGAPLYGIVFAGAGPLLRLWLHGALDPGQAAALRIMLAGSFLSLLGTAPYFTLVGLHCGREVLLSYVVQSGVNVAGIAAAWLWSAAIPLEAVLAATSAGMAASTVYLAWAQRKAVARA